MKPTVVCIDWDFFIYNGEYEHDIALPDGENAPASLVYNFMGKEGWTKSAHDLAWSNRLGLFDQIGLNLRDEYTIREDRGCIEPLSFFSELCHRWPGLQEKQTYIADSQKSGVELIRDTATVHGPVKVISFDAHHSLGYGHESFKDRKRRYGRWYSNWNAGDWLFAALAEGWADEVVVVYPDWRGFDEWQTVDADGRAHSILRDHLRKLLHQITVTTYSQYMQSPPNEGIVANFIARSSGWTPPYLDQAFLEFAHSFNVEGCLDCKKKSSLLSMNGFTYKYDNACEARQFDYDELLEDERSRFIVVQALQRANILYAQGEEEKAEEIIKLAKEAGFDVRLDKWPKYQDSFVTEVHQNRRQHPVRFSSQDETYWDAEEAQWKS